MTCLICKKEFKEGDLLYQEISFDFNTVFCVDCIEHFNLNDGKPNAIAANIEILGTEPIEKEYFL